MNLKAAVLTMVLVLGCGADPEPERAFPPGLAYPAEDSAARDTAIAGPPDAATPSDTVTGAAGASAAAADSGWTVGVLDDPRRDGMTTQRGIRVARQAGYDRIVLDFVEPVSGYHLEYVDTPVRRCGSGDEIRLAGDAWLSVRLEPARAHDDAGQVTVAERHLRPDLANVLELRLICDFEGHIEWVAGLRSPEPYRVLTLRDPSRLVIDIRQPRR